MRERASLEDYEDKHGFGTTIDLFLSNISSAVIMWGAFQFMNLFPKEKEQPYAWWIGIPTFATLAMIAGWLMLKKLYPHRALRFTGWFVIIFTAVMIPVAIIDAASN